MVSRYENIKQILIMEESKPEHLRNKKLIRSAVLQKKELEKQFENVDQQLSHDDFKKFKSALNDDFIIRPNVLKQFSEFLPEGVACIQYLPVGDNIIVYLTIKNTAPFPVYIKLNEKSLSEKSFCNKLVKFSNMLQKNNSERYLKKEAYDLYKVIFAELEPVLAKYNINKLVINASGIMRYIPFAALYTGQQYLVEKYQITNITGLDLGRLSKAHGKHKIKSTEAVIFADPDNIQARRQYH